MDRPNIEGNIFHGRLPSEERFPEMISELIQQLAKLMDVSPEELDFSFQSLEKIDRFAFFQYGQFRCLEPYVFEPLVAYCGEIVRRKTGGRWEMKRTPEGVVEPWIVTSAGRLLNPGVRVFEALWEADQGATIAALIW